MSLNNVRTRISLVLFILVSLSFFSGCATEAGEEPVVQHTMTISNFWFDVNDTPNHLFDLFTSGTDGGVEGTFNGVEELNNTVVDDSVAGSWQNSEIQMTARGVTYTGTFSQDNPTLLVFTSPMRLELRQEVAN